MKTFYWCVSGIIGLSMLIAFAIAILNEPNEKVTEQPPAPIHVTSLQSSGSTTYTTRFYTVEYTDEVGDTYTFLACSLSNGGGITMELLKVNGQPVSHVPPEKITKN